MRIAVPATVLTGLLLASCNSKDEPTTGTDNYLASASVAVTAFSLSPDARVMRNLDSVFFSIDLEHGVIFNADSLPKGTNVTKLMPKITYPSSVTSATITMSGGTHREGTVNYAQNSTDTIDFSGNVTLKLSASGGTFYKEYTLKVNVHKQDPDTIYWERTASSALPSRFENPVAQKAVAAGKEVMVFIQESDGSYTMARTQDIFSASWEKTELPLSFTPDLTSIIRSENGDLYMVSTDGTLLTSSDGISWSAIDSGWSAIIGFYSGTLLGLSSGSGTMYMKSYPQGLFPEMEMPALFPKSGFTKAVTFTNRWTPNPTIVIFGGYPFGPSNSSGSWAFDGSQWVNIAENPLPALTGISVIPYYSFLKNSSNSLLKEFEVYLAFGGMDREGNVNNIIYISYDHGISWQKAQNYMQLPETVTAGYEVDALSIGTTLESNLSNRWNISRPRRIPFEINGDVVSWECPYIFLFGGYDSSMALNPKIRSGVLQRLTFEPLF